MPTARMLLSLAMQQQDCPSGQPRSPELVALLEEGAVEDGQAIPAAADGEWDSPLQPIQGVLVQHKGPGVGKGDACQVPGHPAVVEDEVGVPRVLVLRGSVPTQALIQTPSATAPHVLHSLQDTLHAQRAAAVLRATARTGHSKSSEPLFAIS